MQLSQRLTPSLTTGCQRRSAALSAPCTRRARCRLVASTVGADQQPQSVTPARQEPARSAHPAPANQPEQLNQGGTPVKEDKPGQSVSSALSNSRSDKEAAAHSAVFQDGCLLVGFNTPGTGGSMDLEGMLTA
ncbi:hypothetical protein D9Q98_003003 [Chlorella vulgaris]|uniref:Uncharacterized protein n=1 Tax=Chlorella vulgaris TaxID=3077 RepID=A0A9D4YZS8_CHLVU|nr:hypothetical protein D9Q98_003003 [Chlorella vulgaris]